ncbi:MAG: hypothetical protein NC299_05775 [Lachnospiraceae bacterium]|nr:hypothetical protein [Ruminococcus sp.]MCM1274860.1 hypothetical protein [Lachnospiraceae bacterium]
MDKKTALILLAVFGNVITVNIGFAEAVIIALVGEQHGAPAAVLTALLPAAGHAAASALAYKHFREKRGLSVPKFVMLNALPSVIMGAAGYFASRAALSGGFAEELAPFFAVGSLCVIGYSIVYAALLLAILGLKRAFGKKKELL